MKEGGREGTVSGWVMVFKYPGLVEPRSRVEVLVEREEERKQSLGGDSVLILSYQRDVADNRLTEVHAHSEVEGRKMRVGSRL